MGAAVAFFEVSSPEPDRARRFYGELFGWQVAAAPEMGGYGLVDTAAGAAAIGGGIGPVADGVTAGVRIYVRVDDLEAALQRVEDAGGKVVVQPFDHGPTRAAHVLDPAGNRIGVFTPRP